MATVVAGVIHGKSIELSEATGLSDGQEVSVTIVPAPAYATVPSREPGDGIRRSAGGWSDDPEGLDAYLE